MKLYGSLNNRFEEGQQYVSEIKVGDGVTEYGYTDRYAYEVIEVINQNNIVIRKVDANRIDNNGMSDCQNYEYKSNPNNRKIKLTKRNNVWFEVCEYSKEKLLKGAEEIKKDFKDNDAHKAYLYLKWMLHLTEKQYLNLEAGKIINKYKKMNISVGVMNEYFDYSF